MLPGLVRNHFVERQAHYGLRERGSLPSQTRKGAKRAQRAHAAQPA